jgi:hypothetical protein
MSFEVVVLSVVQDVVCSARAEFEYGTLFVDNVGEEEATWILNSVRMYHHNGSVIMSRVGDEYAYDFT